MEFDTGLTTLSFNTRKSVKEEIGLYVPIPMASSQTFEIGFIVDYVFSTIENLGNQGFPIIKDPVTKP